MVRYFYVWTPLVIVGTVILLSLPWLGLIALMIVSLVAVAVLALAVAFVPYMLSEAIGRLWHSRSDASPRTAAAVSPAKAPKRVARDLQGAGAISLPSRSHTSRWKG